jgi:hypothetical protein
VARIRSMLLNRDPGDARDYPILCLILIDPADRMPIEGNIISPISRRLNGHHTYVFIFGGCTWRYVVSSHSVNIPPLAALSPSGTLPADVISMFEFRPFDLAMREHMQLLRKSSEGPESKGSSRL